MQKLVRKLDVLVLKNGKKWGGPIKISSSVGFFKPRLLTLWMKIYTICINYLKFTWALTTYFFAIVKETFNFN